MACNTNVEYVVIGRDGSDQFFPVGGYGSIDLSSGQHIFTLGLVQVQFFLKNHINFSHIGGLVPF